MGHKYEMGHASLVNLYLILQCVFQKHDELFPDHQKFLTIYHITVQNSQQLFDNQRNVAKGLHQKVKPEVVDTSLFRCQNFRGNVDDIVPMFENPVVSRSKTTYTPLVIDTSSYRCPVAF